MKTKTAPWDYRPRRFNHREHSKYMAVYYDAMSNRKPIRFDDWPEILRLHWYRVRDDYAKVDANRTKKATRQLQESIIEHSAQFGMTFDLWWDGVPLDQARERHEQMIDERPE